LFRLADRGVFQRRDDDDALAARGRCNLPPITSMTTLLIFEKNSYF